MGPIFLSYAGTDREVATRLKEGLAGAGADIWQDVDQIRLGDNWIDTLQAALSECSAYAILIGSGGVQRWVKAELSIAIKRHFDSNGAFPIYPFLLTEVEPEDLPQFLSIFQAERLKLEPASGDYQRLAGWLSHGQERVSAATTEALSTVCPFPGLEAYDEDTAGFFFGRQSETLEALALLGRSRDGLYRRWLQVEGPSGGGKSSLVKAGMIPAIRRGWIEEQGERTARNWQIAIMRPGSAPIDNLAAALGPAIGMAGDTPWLGKLVRELNDRPDALRYLLRERVSKTGRFLLLVDQLEELFTLTEDTHRAEREHFEALLASALQDGDGPFHLITTIRSDFTLRLGELPRLESLLNSRAERYYLKRIDGNALRDVVRTPARLAGLTWDEPTLPDRIVADAADEPSPLPLVSNLLRLLWQRRVGNALCAWVYGELGGVGGALARSADGLLESLGPDGARRAQGLLLRLVKISRDSQPTRRTVTRETALAAAGGGPLAERVLGRLSGAADPDSSPDTSGVRLVAVSRRLTGEDQTAEDVVDLAHEALLTRWSTLSGWIREERDQLEAEEALEEAAWRWQQAGQPWLPGVPARAIRRRYRRARAPSKLAQAYRRSVGLESGLRRTALGLTVGLLALGVVWMRANELNFNHVWAMALSRLPGGLYDVHEPEMVPIPLDKFAPDQPWMGSAEGDSEAYGNEQPQRAVTFQRPFAIGKYEVTWEQYARFAYATGRKLPSDQGFGMGRRPVINVSWHDAVAYADWLSEMTVKGYRLPTEAEWEYAARAGTLTSRFWGDKPKDACAYANVADQSILQKYSAVEIHDCDDGYIETAEVDAEGFEPNPFGLYHMLGNVWEWTCSEYVAEYDGAEQICISNNRANGRRVIRGGSWFGRPAWVRSAYRGSLTPALRYFLVGFRLAQDL